MQRIFGLILLAALAAGGWFVYKNYRVVGLNQVRLLPLGQSLASSTEPVQENLASGASTLRVLSLRCPVLDQREPTLREAQSALVRLVRRFDVIALQGIRSESDQLLLLLTEEINTDGSKYEYAIGPRVGPSADHVQFGFLFNTKVVEIDRSSLYTIADPDDLVHYEPLVGWFRARGVPQDQAFTFSLVNILTDRFELARELGAMDEILRAIRDDGRKEDDVILAGPASDIIGEYHHPNLVPGVKSVLSTLALPPQQPGDLDDVLFQQPATVEYTGRCGVLDLSKELKVEPGIAVQLAEVPPVWAEFSVYEGGQDARVAMVPFTK